MTTYNTERRHILRTSSTAADHDVTTDTAELVNEDASAEDGKIIDNDLASEFCTIAKDTTITDEDVVAYMHALHEKVVVAYDSTSLGCSAAIDGYILANGVVITKFSCGLFATELKILGNGANDSTWEEAVAITDATTRKDSHGIHQRIVVANYNVGVDVAKRPNLAVFANLGFRMDVC